MRRFASVFASNRDKPDTSLKHSHTAPLSPPLSAALSSPPHTPQLSAGSPAHSSASSTGSASLQTPDDDVVPPRAKKSWKSWLGGRKKASPSPPDSQFASWKQPFPDWKPLPSPFLRAPPPGGRITPRADDTDEPPSSDSDNDSVSLPDPAPTLPTTLSPADARRNLRTIIKTSLLPRISPPPFVNQPSGPSFPRSCNRIRSLQYSQSLQSAMHKKRLLGRLEDLSTRLSRAEELSILPFSARHTIPSTHPVPLQFDEPAPTDPSQISSFSAGLRQWIARPCFEDRFAVFTVINGVVTQQLVTGSTFAVAALEYSEALDAMADIDLSSQTPVSDPPRIPHTINISPPSPQASPSPSTIPLQPTQSVHARNLPYIAVPSPLRNEHNTPTASPASVKINPSPPAPAEASGTATVKRGVRFLEDDKDDVVPLGYVLRTKKKKEEKAKFLREEQQRRTLLEEKNKQEEEGHKREREREEWDNERKAWEREKRTMEEERKTRMYAEEVAAARLRRETTRAGGVPAQVISGNPFAVSVSSTSLREMERNRVYNSGKYSRPTYDSPPTPRREASDYGLPMLNTAVSYNSSPGSSRPSSMTGHSPVASGSTKNTSQMHSRPPSVHSTRTLSSSEDVQTRENRAKRNSNASLGSYRPNGDRASSYPMWAGSNQSLQIPPVPPMPVFFMDMPLLPPTPPFMLQQYPRQRSPGGSTSSSSRSRHPNNSNSSLERLNQQRQSQSSRRPGHSPSSSPSSPSHMPTQSNKTRERRPQSEARRSSMPAPHDRGRQPSTPPSHYNAASYGRTSHKSASTQLPSPWTALPTENGRLPASMPMHRTTDARPSASQRPAIIL